MSRMRLVLGTTVIAVLAPLAAPGGALGAFPGANGKIAFSSFRTGNYEIFVTNADGGGQTNITNNPNADQEPAWSPDGTRIAFRSNRTGAGDIYVMNADGSNPVQLTSATASEGQPSWSPDGTKIAFRRDLAGNDEIFVMGADGANPTNISNDAGDDIEPAWAPDGSKIAFASDRTGNSEIFVMGSGGASPANITQNPAADLEPSWAPDGTKIAFTRNSPNHEVFSMDASGANQTNLTNFATADRYPAWSPDGTKIAFNRDESGLTDIRVMPAAGGGTSAKLTSNSSDNRQADWQRIAPAEPPPPAPSADLRMSTIVDTPDPVFQTGTVTYTFTVRNDGPSTASDVRIAGSVTPGATVVGVLGPGCEATVTAVECRVPTLAAGAEAAVSVEVMAPEAPGPITFSAGASASEADPNLADNSAGATTQAGPFPADVVRVGPAVLDLRPFSYKGRRGTLGARSETLSLPITVKPLLPITVKPLLPITVKPLLPITVRPALPITVRPALPITVRLARSQAIRGDRSVSAKRGWELTLPRGLPITVRVAEPSSNLPITVRPGESLTTAPNLPITVRPGSPRLTVAPARDLAVNGGRDGVSLPITVRPGVLPVGIGDCDPGAGDCSIVTSGAVSFEPLRGKHAGARTSLPIRKRTTTLPAGGEGVLTLSLSNRVRQRLRRARSIRVTLEVKSSKPGRPSGSRKVTLSVTKR